MAASAVGSFTQILSRAVLWPCPKRHTLICNVMMTVGNTHTEEAGGMSSLPTIATAACAAAATGGDNKHINRYKTAIVKNTGL